MTTRSWLATRRAMGPLSFDGQIERTTMSVKAMLIVFGRSEGGSLGAAQRTGRWTVSIPVLSGTQPTIVKEFDGTVKNLPEGWSARVSESPNAGSIEPGYGAVVIVAPYDELVRCSGAYDTSLRWEGSVGYSGYTMQCLLWGLGSGANAKWVYPEWLANSAYPSPLNAHLLEFAQTIPAEYISGLYGDGAQVMHWGLFRRDPNGANRAGNLAWGSIVPTEQHDANLFSPLFVPTLAARVYDNTVANAVEIVPPAPVVVVPSTNTASTADLSAIEERMVAMQSAIQTIGDAISRIPTTSTYLNSVAAMRSDSAAVNASVSAVGDYLVGSAVSRTTRMVESAAAAAAVGLLLRK